MTAILDSTSSADALASALRRSPRHPDEDRTPPRCPGRRGSLDDLDDETVEDIRRAVLTHKVVVITGQHHIDDDGQYAARLPGHPDQGAPDGPLAG